MNKNTLIILIIVIVVVVIGGAAYLLLQPKAGQNNGLNAPNAPTGGSPNQPSGTGTPNSGTPNNGTSGNETPNNGTPNNGTSGSGTNVSPGTYNVITIRNFSFNPAQLNIKKGDIVTWTNQDSAPHRISGSGFQSNSLSNGQSFSFTFSVAGTFDYICSIHPSMKGKVIVQ